jgi:hypothetical protein
VNQIELIQERLASMKFSLSIPTVTIDAAQGASTLQQQRILYIVTHEMCISGREGTKMGRSGSDLS